MSSQQRSWTQPGQTADKAPAEEQRGVVRSLGALSRRRDMRHRWVVGAVACAATTLLPLGLTSPSVASPATDYAVTDDGAYVRHDGGTDHAIQHCSTRRPAPPGDSGRRRRRLRMTAATGGRATSRPSPWTRPTPTSSSPAGTTTARPTWRRAGRAWPTRPTGARPGPTRSSPATRPTPRPRGWPRRSTGRTPTPVTRWSPSTTTAGSSSAGSPSTGSSPRTATCGWRPTATRPHPSGTRRTTCGR